MATTTALLSEEEPDLEIGEDSRLLSSPDDEPLGEVQVRYTIRKSIFAGGN